MEEGIGQSRRACREAALQALYQFDSLGEFSLAALQFFLDHFPAQQEIDDDDAAERIVADDFCRMLVQGVVENVTFIDGEISKASANWSIERMARVDRNVLRLAIFEMAFLDDVPHKVSINEAIEISKRFCAPDARVFINGVLDRVAAQLTARKVE